MIMNPYLLPIFALLIVGCGNQSQPSNDAILDDVTQNFNGETENLDSIRVLVRCTEEAQNYFREHSPTIISYKDVEFCALVDSIEQIYSPYKDLILKSAGPISAFTQDTLLLNHGYYKSAFEGLGPKGRYLASCELWHYITRLYKLIDKYYILCWENTKDESGFSPLPSFHAQWIDAFDNNFIMMGGLNEWAITQDVLDMLFQRLLFYYHGCQTFPCSDRFDWSWIK